MLAVNNEESKSPILQKFKDIGCHKLLDYMTHVAYIQGVDMNLSLYQVCPLCSLIFVLSVA